MLSLDSLKKFPYFTNVPIGSSMVLTGSGSVATGEEKRSETQKTEDHSVVLASTSWQMFAGILSTGTDPRAK